MTSADASRPQRALYTGDLAQTPLPEILVTIHRYKAPGVVECRRGDHAKRIFLERGNIVFATTNLLSESLGDMLLRDGRLTREQYDESVRRLRETGKRHGTVLMEMKALTPQELFLSVRRHIQEIVASIFSWEGGTVTFSPGREQHEFVKIDIPVPQAILQGVRRVADARPLFNRVGNRTTILTRTDNVVTGLTLTSDEQRLLDAVDGKRSLADLVAIAPLTPGDNARLLYGFHALQLVEPLPAKPLKIQVRAPR